MTGRFLSLEGGEGAGKSTQARALAAALEARGLPVLVTREPGGSEGAEAIRALLMQGDVKRWSAHAETLLFAAARADHVEKVIRPAIEAGTWVITDRFIDSTRAYQGGAGGIDDAAIFALHGFGSRGLLPDRTFVLDLPIAEGARRAALRDGAMADRFAMRGEHFHADVARAFRTFAAREPSRFRIVDANRSPGDVTAMLLAQMSDLLP
ncbi:dTMP kinase [Sphingomonas jeddahensis]|uniref:Thymidylate kinase n=1 Tax=Sphingomonas jeddahensis TaxID=1915074 RepID=A0A1V2EY35_9SPHN|nr:dTMP kinase [Sphingomonas jeddahensis]ONF97582.1 Thymidylate kinase [Sphingomonas jeddahensis]